MYYLDRLKIIEYNKFYLATINQVKIEYEMLRNNLKQILLVRLIKIMSSNICFNLGVPMNSKTSVRLASALCIRL